jgi:hypothetical protein
MSAVVSPPACSDPEPIFKWETLKEIGSHELQYLERTVLGTIFEIELTSAHTVRVWRAADGQEYFCHGLTFGGKAAPGGVLSPLGDHVPAILRYHYQTIPDAQAITGDIIVWRGIEASDVVHSAILVEPILSPAQNALDYSAKLRTKNGILAETTMTLGQLIENFYGESYSVYRRKAV